MADKNTKNGGVNEFSDGPDSNDLGAAGTAHDARGLTLLTVSDLFARKQPGWMIEGLIPCSALVGLFGVPKCGKSLIALDWSLCTASGRDWNGHKVRKGVVIYIAAEGVEHLGVRIRAWCAANDVDPELLNGTFFAVGCAVTFLDAAAVSDLVDLIRRLRPVLVVIDTLARCTVGADENTAQAMGIFVEHCDTVKRATAGTVLVVHHAGRDGARPRGSSAFDASLDTLMHVSRGAAVKLACVFQKDADTFEPLLLDLRTIALDADERGKERSSCVLVARTAKSDTPSHENLQRKDADVLDAVCEEGAKKPVTIARISALTGRKPCSLHRVVDRLEKQGYVNAPKGVRPRIVSATDQARTFFATSFAAHRTSSAAKNSGSRRSSQPSGPLKGPRRAKADAATSEAQANQFESRTAAQHA